MEYTISIGSDGAISDMEEPLQTIVTVTFWLAVLTVALGFGYFLARLFGGIW